MNDDDGLCCERITAYTARWMKDHHGPGAYPPYTVVILTESGATDPPSFACSTLEGIATLMLTLMPRRGVHIELHPQDEGQGIHDMLAALANDRVRLH